MLETTHRQFPAIVAAARRGAGSAALELDCPWVSSNNGYSLCLLKRGADAADGEEAVVSARLEAQQALLARFEADEVIHARSRRTREFT